MNTPKVDLAAAALLKERRNQPLIIKEEQTTRGNLVIETPSDQAVQVTSKGCWQHHGNIDATGKSSGMSIAEGGMATINGNSSTQGKNENGIHLEEWAQLTLNGDLVASGNSHGIRINSSAHIIVKGKVALSGQGDGFGLQYGLSLQSGANWSSEGMLTAEGSTTAIAIKQATFNHHNDLILQGKRSGFTMKGGLATIKGNVTTLSRFDSGICLEDNAELTLNGDLVASGSSCGISMHSSSHAVVKGKATLSGQGYGVGLKYGLILQSGANWSSEGMLTAKGSTTAIAIEQATFNHHNDLILQGERSGFTMKGGSATIKGNVTARGGADYGLFLEDNAKLALNGDLEVKGAGTGVKIGDISQFSIKSPLKIAIAGKANGLSVGDLCCFNSEGPMTLCSIEKGAALSINGAQSFSHQGTLSAVGAVVGLVITDTSVTITGHTIINGNKGNGLSLSQRSQLILNGALEITAFQKGIKLSDHSQLTVTKAGSIHAGNEEGVKLSEQSHLTFEGSTTIYAGNQTGIKLSEQSHATFKGSTAIHTKRSNGIELATGSTWVSSGPLTLKSPNSTALKMEDRANFQHQGPLTIQGKQGLQLASGSVAVVQSTEEAVSDITCEESALQIEGATLTHQGQLKLTSQGRGIVSSKEGRATIEGTLAINTQMKPAVALSEGATLDLKQTSTTLHCRQATGAVVQLESGSYKLTPRTLTIKDLSCSMGVKP